MTTGQDGSDAAATAAAAELAELHAQVATARTVLVRLLQDVVEAESRLGASQAMQLVEVNEQLVVTALRAQTDAITTALALDDLSQSAERDALTHLPNRLLLMDRFGHAIANARRHGTRLALLFVDLDRFKQINDTLGHAVGDEVLKRVGACLESAVRGGDTVSRHGGDEFLILLTEVSQPADAALIAAKVIALIGAPSRVGEHLLRLSASIGISIFPEDGQDAAALIARADAAMYRAKRHEPGGFTFCASMADGDRELPPLPHAAAQPPVLHYERALAEQERRNADIRDANEQLVLAALGSQQVHAAAALAHARQTHFLAAVARELRDPRVPMRIATAMLGRAAANEPLLPRVQAILDRQAANLSHLVDAMVAHTASAAELPLKPETIDCGRLLGAAVEAIRTEVAARRQSIAIDLPETAIQIRGDRARLRLAVDNLLDNASRYTAPGGRIGLSLAQTNDAAVLTVSDTGIGIAWRALPLVFDPFFQDANATGFAEAGLGIGLTVVKEVVAAHGGTVVAGSAGVGAGSSFVVTLPLHATSVMVYR